MVTMTMLAVQEKTIQNVLNGRAHIVLIRIFVSVGSGRMWFDLWFDIWRDIHVGPRFRFACGRLVLATSRCD